MVNIPAIRNRLWKRARKAFAAAGMSIVGAFLAAMESGTPNDLTGWVYLIASMVALGVATWITVFWLGNAPKYKVGRLNS